MGHSSIETAKRYLHLADDDYVNIVQGAWARSRTDKDQDPAA